MLKPKVYFCSFADSRLQPTLNRIIKEAKESNFFNVVYSFNEFTLNKAFKYKFKHVLKYNVRGFGYWIWKASIIQDVLKRMKDGDILLYADSGCSINKNGTTKFNEYLELVKKSELGILAVSLEENLLEKKYSKGDLFDYLDVREDPVVYDTPQIQAGVILIEKRKTTVDFFRKWQNVYEFNYNLIDDSNSVSSNFKDFIEHRHDQSIFSILFKKYKGVTIPLDEVWVNKNESIDKLKESPIWYLRRKNKKLIGLKYVFINCLKFKLNLKN